MRTHVRFTTKQFNHLLEADKRDQAIALGEWLVEKFGEAFDLDFLDDQTHSLLFVGEPVEKKLVGGCGNVEEETWLVFMVQRPSLMDRLLKRPMPVDLHENFIRALDQELTENPEIFDIEWYQEDSKYREINHANRAFVP